MSIVEACVPKGNKLPYLILNEVDRSKSGFYFVVDDVEYGPMSNSADAERLYGQVNDVIDRHIGNMLAAGEY